MILVTTAGKVGAEATRILAGRGEPVRVLVRDRNKAKALGDAGAEVIEGDLADPTTLQPALEGVTSVILVSPAIPDQELNVVQAAKSAGAQHIVKITSKGSADSPIQRRRDQTTIEEGIMAAGLNHTFLRNNAYMQNFLMLAPAIREGGTFGASVGDGRVGMIDTRDVAEAAAEIAAATQDHRNATYLLSGPEALTYTEAAEVLSKVLGKTVSYHALTPAEQTRAMIDAGLPAHVAHMNAQALSLFAEGDSEWVTEDVAKIVGHGPRSFENFVTDHAAIFA